jgi:hypothetical protein
VSGPLLPDVPADELRVVRFWPAHHRCHPDPTRDYGIASVRMFWALRVGDWAMTWDVHTGWDLPDEAFLAAAPDCEHPRHRTGPPPDPGKRAVMGGAVDWHSPVPRFDGHELAQETCAITGAPCYLDSGFSLGSDLFDLLRTAGDEAVWKRLRELLDEARAE